MKRIVVVGCAGAGKTTLSRQLAHRLQVSYVERDALGDLVSETYRSAVRAVLEGDAWVFDGPPYCVDAVVYPATETVVWLDYNRLLIMGRAIGRSARRAITRRVPGQERW